MSILKHTEKSITFQMRDELVLVEPYGKDAIRVRATRNNTISDQCWTLLPPTEDSATVTEIHRDRIALENGSMKAEVCRVWGGYRIHFYKNGNRILSTREEGDAVRKYSHMEGDNYQTRALFEANKGEHIYGLGQEQTPYFDKKGCSSELIHYNTKSAMPVIYSSLGYGFFWNNPSPGRVEFTNNHTLWQADSAYQADYIVFAGATPKETMTIYSRLTGFSPKMPDWAAGFWQCKLRYESQDDLLEVARKYHELKIPVDAIVIDYFHWTEQGNWEFEPSLWPDPKAMCDELYSMNIRPIVSFWPTINPNSKNFSAMDEENMLVRTENGQRGTFEFYGLQDFIDPTNPRTREYVWEQIKKTYYSYGIKTYWLDEAEPEVHPQQFKNLKFYIGNGAQTALTYPYYYQKLFYDALKAEGEEDVATLTRASYPGSQKFGAIVWNGDIPSTFQALFESIVSGLSMAMCGIVWWNSDIGGFHQGDIESDYFRELIVRWFQFGLFCPVMRLHGARKKPQGYVPRHPGVKEVSGGDNEIWSFGERNFPILKDLILLRNRLKPYILHHMDIASKEGTPMMRPLFFDYYNDERCYNIDDEYLFGDDILFAPIYREGEVERKVYLPEGVWVRTSDKKEYEGGREYTCHAEIDEFIAFCKKGADVLNVF